jgi:hypothetical protein
VGIAFRSILQFDKKDLDVSAAKALVERWLQNKGWKESSTSPQTQKTPEKTLTYVESLSPDHSHRWLLSEYWAKPPWAKRNDGESRTTITLLERGDQIWTWIDIDTPIITFQDSKSGQVFQEPQFAHTPGLVDDLLKNKPFDGLTPIFRETPIIRRDGHIRELASRIIPDESRFGAVYATTPPQGVDESRWSQTISKVLDKSRGMGAAYIVHSSSLELFNNIVGRDFALSPGSIRTFLPGAKLDDPADSQRHRRLTYETLNSRGPDKAGRMLRSIQVARLRAVHLPSFFLDAERALTRELRPATELLTSSSGFVSVEEYKDLVALADLYAKELDQERAERTDLSDIREFLMLENSELAKENDKLQAQRDYLLAQSRSSNQMHIDLEQDFETPPESWGELIERMATFERIRFAGDPEDVYFLEQFEIPQSALRKAWKALRTFSSFAAMKNAGDFDGSLEQYVSSTAHGGFSAVPKLKWESESVENNPKFRRQRLIPVPKAVDTSEEVMCKQHITLYQGRPTPTMYLFDAVGRDGNIYVGYLGVHLDNTKTN